MGGKAWVCCTTYIWHDWVNEVQNSILFWQFYHWHSVFPWGTLTFFPFRRSFPYPRIPSLWSIDMAGRTWDERQVSDLVFNMAFMKLPKAQWKSNFECMFLGGNVHFFPLMAAFKISMEAFIFLTLLVIWTDMGPRQPVQNLQHCSAEHQMFGYRKACTTFIQSVCKLDEFPSVGWQHAVINIPLWNECSLESFFLYGWA